MGEQTFVGLNCQTHIEGSASEYLLCEMWKTCDLRMKKYPFLRKQRSIFFFINWNSVAFYFWCIFALFFPNKLSYFHQNFIKSSCENMFVLLLTVCSIRNQCEWHFPNNGFSTSSKHIKSMCECMDVLSKENKRKNGSVLTTLHIYNTVNVLQRLRKKRRRHTRTYVYKRTHKHLLGSRNEKLCEYYTTLKCVIDTLFLFLRSAVAEIKQM